MTGFRNALSLAHYVAWILDTGSRPNNYCLNEIAGVRPYLVERRHERGACAQRWQAWYCAS